MNLKNKNVYLKIIALLLVIHIIADVFIISYIITTKTVEKQHNNIVMRGNISFIRMRMHDTEPKIDKMEFIDIQVPTWVAGFDEGLLSESTNDIIPKLLDDKLSKFSKNDINLLARVTMSEASTQSFDVQVAVAQTIVNRLHMGIFGDTIYEIVYEPNQYSTADNGAPNKQVIDAVTEAITHPPYPPDMVYFRENYYHKWALDYKKIGVFYFSLEP
jgi:hypothetical protein